MTRLEVLGISGIRSYASHSIEKIEFDKPLTLVWGKNGSGKTTIIEALRYLTTGTLPPNSDKGKRFLADPKLLGKTEVEGSIRLKFRAFNGRQVVATRRSLLTVSNRGSKFESLEQVLKTRDEKTGQVYEINHQCAEMEKQVPSLLGCSKAILEKIMFCHQEEALWPFEENLVLKSIFDELFQTQPYTDKIESFTELRKAHLKDIAESEKKLEYHKRIYEEDRRRKREALDEMQRVCREAEQIMKMKKRIGLLEGELEKLGSSKLSEEEIQLRSRQNSTKESLVIAKHALEESQAHLNTLRDVYMELKSVQLQSSPELSSQQLPAITEAILEQERKQEQLKEKIIAVRFSHYVSQKEAELAREVQRAYQLLPEQRNRALSEEELLGRVKGRLDVLAQKKQRVWELRHDAMRYMPREIVSNGVTEKDCVRQQAEMAELEREVEREIEMVGLHFISLFRKGETEVKVPGNWTFQNYEHKLKEVEYRLQVKREQIERVANLPNATDIRDSMVRLKVAGIEVFQGYLEFCEEKKKCPICGKGLDHPQDFNYIRNKSKKMKEKTLKQLAQLEERLRKEDVGVVGNPEQLMKNLRREVDELEQKEEQLIDSVEREEIMKREVARRETNTRLLNGMKAVGLSTDLEQIGKKGREPIETNIHKFEEAILVLREKQARFQRSKVQYGNMKDQLARFAQAVESNREKEAKASEVGREIEQLQRETEGIEVLRQCWGAISGLLKEREKEPKRERGEKETVEQLTEQLSALERATAAGKTEREYHEEVVRIQQLCEKCEDLEDEMEVIGEGLGKLQVRLKRAREIKEEVESLKLEFTAKNRELDLREEIAYQAAFRPTEKEYLKERLRVNQLKGACKDIEQHCQMVENVIKNYHKQKMDEINKIIRDLWREIYHEGDITQIEIKAEVEEDSRKKYKKNYHYSIIQHKRAVGEARVEMKGSSSMGQKILASLIIRLALAEAFAYSAKVLTLDEPTVHLDRQHVEAFAKQLSQLIEMHQESDMLQLVIITHDLEFIRLLQEYTDHYYEISRNNHNFSVIKRREITEIFQTNRTM